MKLLIAFCLAATPSVGVSESNKGRDRDLSWTDAGLILGGAAGYLGLHKAKLKWAIIDWSEPGPGPRWQEDTVPTTAVIGAGVLLALSSGVEGGLVEAAGMAQAGLVTTAVTNIFKVLFARPRPDFVDRTTRTYDSPEQRDEELRDARLSLPSGHSSAAFAFATQTGLWLHRAGCMRGWSTTARYAGYIVPLTIASAVAWTRVSDNRHYPSDVVAGALLGSGVTLGLDRWQNGRPRCP
ncbi:MAG: hypothetical protein CMH50_07060 [Myxococcales bacterium]|nr:hypothetical protein [Myxococcales bacterium]